MAQIPSNEKPKTKPSLSILALMSFIAAFMIAARDAHIIGEHGDSKVPVWSLANVAGIRLKDYCPICKIPYDLECFNDLFLKVRNA